MLRNLLIIITLSQMSSMFAQATESSCGTCGGSGPSCNDGVKNGKETAVDCGGDVCAPCGTNKGCKVNADCQSQVCSNYKCRAATCYDCVQNQGETGIDCGGPCSPCTFGSLVLAKSVVGAPSGYNPQYTINYACSGNVSGSVTMPAGSSRTVTGIATGALCSISEPTLPTPPAGYTFRTPSFSPGSVVTVGASTLVTVTNSLFTSQATASLRISKTVANPDAIAVPTSFLVDYNCGTGFSGQVAVSQLSAPTVVSGIPVGRTCTVVEVPPAAIPDYTWSTTYSPASVTLSSTGIFDVAIQNAITKGFGSLTLIKTLSGGPSGYSGPFTLHYDCGQPFVGDVALGAGGSVTIPSIPVGVTCTVTEILPTAPDGLAFAPPEFLTTAGVSNTIKIESTTISAQMIVRNRLDVLPTLTIIKTALPAQGSFIFNTTGNNYPSFILTGSTANGGNVNTRALLPGVYTIQEMIPQGWTLTRIGGGALVPLSSNEYFCTTTGTNGSFGKGDLATGKATVTLQAGDNVTCLFENSLQSATGSLVLKKTLNGGPVSSQITPFTIHYNCGGSIVGDVQLVSGGTQTIPNIAPGTQCTVSEPSLPATPEGYTFNPPVVSPSSTVFVAGTTLVEVTNTLVQGSGSLQISKQLSNPDGATNLPSGYLVNYDCGAPFMGQVTVVPGTPQIITGIPSGNLCTVIEVPPASIPDFTWQTATYAPASVTISLNTTAEIVVTNSIVRTTGSLVLSKALTGGPGGDAGSFTIQYQCSNGISGSVNLAPGTFEAISGIPTGTSCTVSEPILPGAPFGFAFDPPVFSPFNQVTVGLSTSVTTVNSLHSTQPTGTLRIIKMLSNPDIAAVIDNFIVRYDCGAGFIGETSVSTMLPADVVGIPLGRNCTVVETAPDAIPGFIWSQPTYTPGASVSILSTTPAEITVGNAISLIQVCSSPPCNTGEPCSVDTDCIRGDICRNNVCEVNPDCTNKCGGVCQACPVGELCTVDSDCVSGNCKDGVCITPPVSCTNGIKDPNESDVDCGGSCKDCQNGQSCTKDTECVSTNCKDGVCIAVPATCSNLRKDGNESGVDCGGSCPDCSVGETCLRGSDCTSGVCAGGVCAPPDSCNDKVKNFSETGVDCGGPFCQQCKTGETCLVDSDCAGSDTCTDGVCAPYCYPASCDASIGTQSDSERWFLIVLLLGVLGLLRLRPSSKKGD